MPEYICVQCINIFKDLTEDERQEIISSFKKEKFSKGETIFTPFEDFENFYMVHSGKIILYEVSASGKKIINNVLENGDIFFNFSLLLDIKFKVNNFAEALDEVLIYKMNKKDFLNIILKYPKVALNVIKELVFKLNEADNRIRDLALNSASIRAINELLRLSKKYGIDMGQGKIKINIRLTHEEFAEMIGTSRETATRILKKLKKLAFIDITKEHLIVFNKNKIEEPI